MLMEGSEVNHTRCLCTNHVSISCTLACEAPDVLCVVAGDASVSVRSWIEQLDA